MILFVFAAKRDIKIELECNPYSMEDIKYISLILKWQ